MGTRIVLAAGLVAAAVALGGCSASGQGAAEGTPTSNGGAVTSPGTTPTGSPTGGPIRPPQKPPATTEPPGGPVGEVTLRGVVEEGVEAGCTVFKADNGIGYELIGVSRDLLRPGYRLEVTGSKAVGMASICMQGQLFRVSSARRI